MRTHRSVWLPAALLQTPYPTALAQTVTLRVDAPTGSDVLGEGDPQADCLPTVEADLHKPQRGNDL